MSRLTTFLNGIRSMRPMLELRWYWWGFGPHCEGDPFVDGRVCYQ